MQVVEEMQKISERMQTVIDQATFNGDNLLKSTAGTWNGEKWINTDERSVVSGVSRVNGNFETTTIKVHEILMQQIQQSFENLADSIAPLNGLTPHEYQLLVTQSENFWHNQLIVRPH